MGAVWKVLRLGTNLVRIASANPRRLSHVLGSALAASEEVVDRRTDLLLIPSVRIEELLPARTPGSRAILALIAKTDASVSLLEWLGLILLAKKAAAGNVFEFGTYKGVSTTQLALNLSEGGHVFTLDLPEDDPRSALPISDPEDRAIAFETGKGSLVPDNLRSRITFLRQDSATFDETPHVGQIDFVFVDGAHNVEYVRNDSQKGWRMLRAGGIIAWHDCRIQDPDVVRFLLQTEYRPMRVSQTTLAFAVKPAS